MAAEKPEVITDQEEKEVSLSPAPPETPDREPAYIRFNSGDSLEAIAEKYETTVEAICERNKLNPAALQVGHWLFV
jgi:LysM repeat protein